MATSPQSSKSSLGIIAGGGAMPLAVARAAEREGRPLHIVALDGWAKPDIEAFPHSWVKIGQFGKIVKLLNQHDCKELVIVGSVERATLSNVRLDATALANLPTLISVSTGGDNSVLGGIVQFFEDRGFQIVGAHEIAPELLAEPGPLGKHSPSEKDQSDIDTAVGVIGALGPFDVGQAVVVAEGYVLAVEAAEGTDRMLERCRDLKNFSVIKRRKTGGVLVKCAKPGQDQRLDLPTIGPETVRRAADAGLSGIAVSAHAVLIADRDETLKEAERHRLFIVGLDMADHTSSQPQ